MNTVINVSHISKIYGESPNQTYALQDVNLKIKSGEFVAIIGPSGSGKSTLMNILGCLDRPSSGTYHFEDRLVSALSERELAKTRNQKLGFVFQSFNLLARTSALKNVELPLIYSGIKESERIVRAQALLEKLGLGERLDNTPAKLSGGQQQRVAIARALINDPLVIFADEPTGNLDTKSSEEIMEIFRELNREGKTIVMITHEMEVAQQAKRIIRILDGKVVEDYMNATHKQIKGLKKKEHK